MTWRRSTRHDIRVSFSGGLGLGHQDLDVQEFETYQLQMALTDQRTNIIHVRRHAERTFTDQARQVITVMMAS
jgi:hypothetical protein